MLSYSYSYINVIRNIRSNRVDKRKAGTTTAPAFLDDFFLKVCAIEYQMVLQMII